MCRDKKQSIVFHEYKNETSRSFRTCEHTHTCLYMKSRKLSVSFPGNEKVMNIGLHFTFQTPGTVNVSQLIYRLACFMEKETYPFCIKWNTIYLAIFLQKYCPGFRSVTIVICICTILCFSRDKFLSASRPCQTSDAQLQYER